MCGAADLLPRRIARLERAAAFRMKGLRIVMDNVADPGNRAAVMRTAEALGLLHVHVISKPLAYERQVPLVSRKQFSRAVTTGSEKWLHLHSHPTAQDCLQALREDLSIRVLCAKPESPARDSLRGVPTPLQDIDFGEHTALVFGNEHRGVSEEMTAMADGDFTIPMFGLTESLNISVAAAISIHWGRTARERAVGAKTDLSEEETRDLLERYSSLSTKYQAKMRQLRKGLGVRDRPEMWERGAEDGGESKSEAA
mmetsp:Transcript_22471/g.55404  ORF Transcript_22471/g.55404 Transcript_22471/m.55404 type:complete len:255 (-) Transcript_22471:292-1056(-)